MKKKVPVHVFAKQYENSKPLAGAGITDIETGEKWVTDRHGYAKFEAEAGRRLSLKFNKAGFPEAQTASVTVPEEGLTGHDHEITLQVPGKKLYKALRAALGKPKPGTHAVVTTVSAFGHNLHNDKGEGGVEVTLRSKDGKIKRDDAIYLGTVLGKTEWLRPIVTSRVSCLNKFRHKATSHDGGALFRDVPPGEYIIEARKKGVVFSASEVTICKNSPEFVNVSPPHSPHVVRPAATSHPAAKHPR